MQLFGRVYNILPENNLELSGDRRRTIIRPPQVLRKGTKKTLFLPKKKRKKKQTVCQLYGPLARQLTR